MKRTKKAVFLCLISLLFLLLTGMSAEAAEISDADLAAAQGNPDAITSLDQLNGKDIGCLEGSNYIGQVRNKFDESTVLEYNSNADLIAALKSGRIAAYIIDDPIARIHLRETEGITVIDEFITKDQYGFMLNLKDQELCNDINAVISELKEEGFLDELKEKWVTSQDSPVFDTSQPWDKPNGTLKVSLSLDSIPFAYLQNGEIVGYDVELIYGIAEKLGYGVEITTYEFSALLESISSGREDVAVGCIPYTPERAEKFLFTDSTYDNGSVAVVLDGSVSSKGFLEKLGESFERTFIKESRWKLVANGLLITLELSVLTLIFGSLAGFGFSFLLRSKNRVIRSVSCAVSTVIGGLPLLIILMVFYYIIFSKTTVSAVLIGVIGLSLNFANVVAGLLNTGVESVDKGQIEAAESMGYPKRKIFTKIIFPQAANHIFSQYIGSVIGMIKGTSVIGYITVVDLTKAGDIIRSLTYEAFFPLISVAAIYFLFAQIITAVLKMIAKRMNPKHRKRQIKGVKVHD